MRQEADRQESKKDKAKGIIITIVFHAGILAILLLMALRTPLPLPEEEGVEVNLGYSDEGMGDVQPLYPSVPEDQSSEEPEQASETVIPEETPTEQVEEEVVKQTTEEAPPIDNKVIEKKPEEKPAPEPPKVNQRALYKGKSNNTGGASTGGEGITGKPGDQGNPNGIPGSMNYEGEGGSGSGISYNLGSRKAKALPKPDYTSKEQGKVVVNIWVDRNGKVIRAEAGAKGTNVSDSKLWDLARRAALQSTFDPDPNAADLQTGTITYNFIKLN